MARAEAAQRSVTVRDWIISQRKAIDRIGWGTSDRASIRDEMQNELAQSDDRRGFLEELVGARAAFRENRVANADQRALLAYELTLCETWINAHFTGTTGPGNGYVVVIFDTDADSWTLVGTRVLVPYAEKVKDHLNAILRRAGDPRATSIRDGLRPFALDLRVHKYVVFGHKWSDFLDAENAEYPMGTALLQIAYPKWGAFFDSDNIRLTTPSDDLSRLRMEAALDSSGRLKLNLEPA